jgi:hypothetical protein
VAIRARRLRKPSPPDRLITLSGGSPEQPRVMFVSGSVIGTCGRLNLRLNVAIARSGTIVDDITMVCSRPVPIGPATCSRDRAV